jgi:hypothetical protein
MEESERTPAGADLEFFLGTIRNRKWLILSASSLQLWRQLDYRSRRKSNAQPLRPHCFEIRALAKKFSAPQPSLRIQHGRRRPISSLSVSR